jgi:hypothetical protein
MKLLLGFAGIAVSTGRKTGTCIAAIGGIELFD